MTDEAIDQLERKHRIRLSDELRAVYRWHNGMADQAINFLPGHGFQSLEDALKERDEILNAEHNSTAQWLVTAVLLGHRQHWLTVFPDWGGSGYFFDPKRHNKPGSFFYHFDEDRHYIFFPCLANFIAYLIEAYESKTFRVRDEGLTLDADFEVAMELESRYGSSFN
ncbi:MAG: SMI1/KNR4 family protein [Planctomycetota bacterium]